MQQLYLITYRLREGFDEEGLRQLTKKFTEVGNAPGVIADYACLAGTGGFVIQESQEDPEGQLREHPAIPAMDTRRGGSRHHGRGCIPGDPAGVWVTDVGRHRSARWRARRWDWARCPIGQPGAADDHPGYAAQAFVTQDIPARLAG
jgi:hypothetical protein